jgi:N-acetylglucosamine-6-phosphate deacetylase
MVSKLLYLMVFGAVGGVLAWFVNEPFISDDITRAVDWGEIALFGSVSGLFIGAMIGLATGLSLGTGKHILRAVALGAGVGAIGGWVGLTVGQILFGVLGATVPLLGLIVGRILGWSAFGALIGLSEGLIARSPKRMRNGALGGAIGGALGGALFDFLAFTLGSVFGFALRAEGEAGAPSRAVGLTLIGAGIGLFIGLLEWLTRAAWVRVLYGRNEGKDYPIDRDGAYLGRDELADVPLRGDPQVAPRHAEIRMDGGGYVLIPLAPMAVNGQPVSAPVELNDGDLLQIGSFRVQFQLREGQAARAPRDVARSPLPPPPPTPPGVCPYCGQRQDPLTGACACTPVALPAPTTPSYPSAPTRRRRRRASHRTGRHRGRTRGTAYRYPPDRTDHRARDGQHADYPRPVGQPPSRPNCFRERRAGRVRPEQHQRRLCERAAHQQAIAAGRGHRALRQGAIPHRVGYTTPRMAFRVYCGALVTDGQRYPHRALVIDKGRIVAWEAYDAAQVEPIQPPDVDARDLIALPGMIDLHVHGGFGRDMMEGTPDAIRAIAHRLASYGVTAFLVTPLTAPWSAIRQCIEAAREVRWNGSGGARVLGCHLEGPFINPKRAGAQPPEHIRPPSLHELKDALGTLINELRIVTLAPELDGAREVIEFLTQEGVIVSIGHSDATYEQTVQAIEWGARHATHTFNAMRPFQHRDPGLAGAVMLHDELTAEIIWDNVHTHPATAQLLIKAKGATRVVCVSDGATGVGMPDGYTFELWGHRAVVKEGAARMVETGGLAGSIVAMDACLRHCAQTLGLEVASLVCAANPARALGYEADLGTLRPGACADFLLWNSHTQKVEYTYIDGALHDSPALSAGVS